ncbi:MAG: hypothetical protein LBC41_00550 [Clostridiales bacterium]|jgi:hypothetical protein|nr:hypothetical protein [Clostridiales bacterium]
MTSENESLADQIIRVAESLGFADEKVLGTLRILIDSIASPDSCDKEVDTNDLGREILHESVWQYVRVENAKLVAQGRNPAVCIYTDESMRMFFSDDPESSRRLRVYGRTAMTVLVSIGDKTFMLDQQVYGTRLEPSQIRKINLARDETNSRSEILREEIYGLDLERYFKDEALKNANDASQAARKDVNDLSAELAAEKKKKLGKASYKEASMKFEAAKKIHLEAKTAVTELFNQLEAIHAEISEKITQIEALKHELKTIRTQVDDRKTTEGDDASAFVARLAQSIPEDVRHLEPEVVLEAWFKNYEIASAFQEKGCRLISSENLCRKVNPFGAELRLGSYAKLVKQEQCELVEAKGKEYLVHAFVNQEKNSKRTKAFIAWPTSQFGISSQAKGFFATDLDLPSRECLKLFDRAEEAKFYKAVGFHDFQITSIAAIESIMWIFAIIRLICADCNVDMKAFRYGFTQLQNIAEANELGM